MPRSPHLGGTARAGRGPFRVVEALIVLAIVAVGVTELVVQARQRQSQQDPVAIATAYRRALNSGDAGSMLALASSSELRLNNMTPDDFGRFVHEWVRPKLAGRAWIGVTVGRTEEGLKVVQPISSLVLAFAALDKDGHPPSSDLDKLHDYVENVPAFGRQLKAYGIEFISPSPSTDPMTVERFGEACLKQYRQLTKKR